MMRAVSGGVEALKAEGHAAFRRGDGVAARKAYEAALAIREDGEALEGLARARYLDIDYKASIAAHERAYAAYRRENNALGAARAARMLAWSHANLYGDWAVHNGWLARAQTVLEAAGQESLEHGWVELLKGNSDPDVNQRHKHLQKALDLGRRFGSADLEFEALGQLGLGLVFEGQAGAGMPLIDEALAAVCAGEVEDLFVVEGVVCGMFWACERTHDVARAEQWIRVAQDVAARRGVAAVGAFCRAHYGSILTAAGRWSEAEAELTEAARLFERGYVAMRSDVMVRLADLRVRQGRFEEAEQLLVGLDQHPDARRPLAALYLARGETVLALDLIERALTSPELGATGGPFLALAVDAHLASGALEAAEHAAERLTNLAEQCPSDFLRALAALAHGKLCVATGRGDARSCLQTAVDQFARAQMPVEVARARLELARAVGTDRLEVAIAEAKAALAAFERLSATRDADAAAAVLRSLGASGRTGPKQRATLTRREAEVLSLLSHGLSNPQIGDRLFISGKTVEHHVGRILSKLGLRNRTEAAAYATRSAGEKISV